VLAARLGLRAAEILRNYNTISVGVVDDVLARIALQASVAGFRVRLPEEVGHFLRQFATDT
jgi:hypothetical protein